MEETKDQKNFKTEDSQQRHFNPSSQLKNNKTTPSINNASPSKQVQQDDRDVQQHPKLNQQAKRGHRRTTKTPLQSTR